MSEIEKEYSLKLERTKHLYNFAEIISNKKSRLIMWKYSKVKELIDKGVKNPSTQIMSTTQYMAIEEEINKLNEILSFFEKNKCK